MGEIWEGYSENMGNMGEFLKIWEIWEIWEDWAPCIMLNGWHPLWNPRKKNHNTTRQTTNKIIYPPPACSAQPAAQVSLQ